MLDAGKTKEQLIAELAAARQRCTDFEAGEIERKQAGEHLRELADFVRFNPAPVLRVAPDGRILHLNPAAEKVLGPNRVGTSAYDILTGLKGVHPAEIEPDNPLRLETRLGERYFTFAVVTSSQDDSIYIYGADITERKRAEEALHQRKELFRTLVDNAGDAIYLVDATGRLLEVNREAERQTSFSRNKLLSMDVTDLDLNQSPELFAAFVEVMAKERTVSFETRHRRKDGSHFSVELTVVRLESEAGPVFISIARDTTERKRAEEALHALEKSYREMVEYAPIGIFQSTPQGRYLMANTWLAKMYGYDSAQDLVENVWDIGAQLYVNASERKDLKMAGERDVIDRMECRRRRKDGSIIWVALSMRTVRDPAGRVLHYEGFAADITGRKRSEEALRESEALLAKSQELAHVGSWDLDIASHRLRWSDETFRIFGMEPQLFEATYDAFLDAVHPDDRDEVDLAYFESVRQGRSNYELEHRIVKKDTREIRCVYEWCRHIKDNSGQVVRSIGTVQDITAKVLAENELKEALNKADAANRAKSEFLANMTHEIRTPLNGVLGMLQLLETSELTEEQKDYVATCAASANILLELIDSILDLARIEAGKLGIVEGEFLFSDLCHAFPSLFEAQITAKRLGFAMDIAQDVPSYIVGDAGRIRQVLVNLIGNAVKFTKDGGVKVLIEAGEEVSPGRMKLRFSVSDTGIGIPKDQISRLFTPFTQVDGSATRRYQGSGLGLSIVKRLVELMGGEVSIESELGRGTTVRFDILVGVAG
jgi:PAS domain S-box-containing protein